MSIDKDFEGQLPSGEKTQDYSEYKESWRNFTNKIEKLLNAQCYIPNSNNNNNSSLIPKFVVTKSKTSGEEFNLPIWAAKRMLGDYILAEHNVEKIALCSKEEIEKKLSHACDKDNSEFVQVVLENDSVQKTIDAKTINKVLGQACYINRPAIVEFITSHKKFSKEVDINTIADSFIVACMDGHMEAVKSIVKNIKTPIDKNLFTLGVDGACYKGRLNMVKYILESSELKEHLDIKNLKNHVKDNLKYYKDKEITHYLSEGLLKESKVKKVNF